MTLFTGLMVREKILLETQGCDVFLQGLLVGLDREAVVGVLVFHQEAETFAQPAENCQKDLILGAKMTPHVFDTT